jgi:hypothetical protein
MSTMKNINNWYAAAQAWAVFLQFWLILGEEVGPICG